MRSILWVCFRQFKDGGAKLATFNKLSQTCPTMTRLGTVIPYIKKTYKYMNHVTNNLRSGGTSIFLTEISNFCYIKKYKYRLHFNP